MQSDELRFGFLLKSYRKDYPYTLRLLRSFVKHNVDQLPLYLVVPQTDGELFSQYLPANVTLIFEESIRTKYASESVNGIREGYINQQIVKLAFHRKGLLDTYLCLDSDAEFLTDFYRKDFIADSGQNFHVLLEDRDLQTSDIYFFRHWQQRDKELQKIRKYLNLNSRTNSYLTCHGFQIFNSRILKDFERKLLGKGLDFIDLLKIAPYEFSWYNFFVEKEGYILEVREPYFKYVHTGEQFALEKLSGLNIKAISRGFLGVVLNSNFSVFKKPMEWQMPTSTAIAVYLPMGKQLVMLAKLTLGLVKSVLIFPIRVMRRRIRIVRTLSK